MKLATAKLPKLALPAVRLLETFMKLAIAKLPKLALPLVILPTTSRLPLMFA